MPKASSVSKDDIASLIRRANSVDADTSKPAIHALKNMGPEIAPQLSDAVSVEGHSPHILAILISIDANAITEFRPQIITMLGASDQSLVRHTIDALTSAGKLAHSLLFSLLGDQDPNKQQNSANILINIGKEIIESAMRELENPNAIVQQNAIRILAEIGHEAKPNLLHALNSNSQLLSQNARQALMQLYAFHKSETPIIHKNKRQRIFGIF